MIRRNVLSTAPACLLVLATVPAYASTTHSWLAAVPDNWSDSYSWQNDVPNAAGDVAQHTSTNTGDTVLDMNATIGSLLNTPGSGTRWTIESDGVHSLTFDNTGGPTNAFGTANAYIGYTSSGPLVVNPSLILKNTDLDIGSTNGGVVYVAPGVSIGILGSTSITAATAQTLNLRENANTVTGGATPINIYSDIGGFGSAISIANVGTGNGPVSLLGNLLSAVAAVTQASSTSTLALAGNNTYSGPTLVSAGSLLAEADHALGKSDITLESGTQLTLSGGSTNDYIADTATLSLNGSPVINLNYTGTDLLGSLMLNGAPLPAGSYGSATSGAATPLPFFTGSGTLTVVGVPEPASLALAGPIGLALLLRRGRARRITA